MTDPFLPALARLGAGADAALLECLDTSAWIDFELGIIEEPANLEGARRVNMPALHFTSATALKSELRARGLLP